MDRISLINALEHDIWEMVWVGEPNREVSVEMTYNDLKTIVECLKKGKKNDKERSNKQIKK